MIRSRQFFTFLFVLALGFNFSLAHATGSKTKKRAMKKEKKYKVVNMKHSVNVGVSPEALWKIVAVDFGDAHKWASSLEHSEAYGEAKFDGATCSNRACDINSNGFSSIKEVIAEFDEKNHTFSYDVIEGFPSFVVYGNNRWVITPDANGNAQVEMQITMKMKKFMGFLMGGMMKKNLKKLLQEATDDLKVYAETGQPSERKQEQLAKLAKK